MDLLWTDFANSQWYDWRGSGRSEDRLEQPEWIANFVAKWALDVTGLPDGEELRVLKELRDLLRRMSQAAAAGKACAADDLRRLNDTMALGPVTRRLTEHDEGYELALIPAASNWISFSAEIAASFAVTLDKGEAARIRVCDNQDCLWVFYDDTRNRSKRFCDDKLCGNLMKVRRFRARRQSKSLD